MDKLATLAILFMLLSCGKKNPSSTDQIPASSYQVSELKEFNEEFMDLVNQHRVQLGLNPLKESSEISDIALIHSENMAQGLIPFGHEGFSLRCDEAREIMGKSYACGENVAYGQKTPQAVFQAWINSEGHRINIEKPSYTHCGIGIAKNTKGTLYWTHLLLQVP